MLKTDLYSAIKSDDSEALDSGTSQLGSHRGFGGIEMLACWKNVYMYFYQNFDRENNGTYL